MTPQRNTGAGAEAELPEYAGHYRLESCLGSGGMGVVHLAHSASGLKLAVKVVHAEFARDPEFRGRFRQEVAAARRVSGAFTAPVVDADPEADRPWMATLFIPGLSLSEHVKRNGPMDPGQLRRLMAGLAEALRDIHRAGVVHRDLKPSNVLLAGDGPKVIDFGISRPKDSELRTETGKLIGTPPFMAPEQFRRPRDVGPAADIFALGSLMVHAATGRGPFDSDSPYVVAYQVVHDEPDLTGVPESLAPLVLRCLAKEPENRPTPGELMQDLRLVAASYDTQAFIPAQRAGQSPEPKGRATDSKRRPRRRVHRLAGLALGVLSLVAGGAFAAVQLFGDGPPTVHAAGPRSAPASFAGWDVKAPGRAGAPQCSYTSGKLLCAQTGVVFALSASDGTLLWRHSAPKGRPGGPPVMSGGLVQPSLDGGRHLEALDPASGRPRWQRNVPPYAGIQQAGGMLLLTRADGTVTGVDSATGRTTWSRRIPGYAQPSLAAFPADPLVYAASASNQGTRTRVTAVDPKTGDVRFDVRLDGYLKPVGAEGGSVFFADGSAAYEDVRAVVRYTPATGEQRRVPLPYPLERPRFSLHGSVVHVLGAGGALLAVDLEARVQRWSLQTAVSRGSVPVAGPGRVYFSAADGRLLAVDARTGRLLGQTRARLDANSGELATAVPAPVAVGNRVYGTAPDGTVFAVGGNDPSAW
ncbi:serine/threonine-protein kinase [Streptomyces carpinensis]|uniref:Serine/threonine-protein kinase n=1 Tax=Streptomyces carpinensis TaxID=66369 RepID=A0ABV1W107_9ACTN|nr:serine/threonine-protein kinase [Streptomyces carpinensis]